MSGYHLRIDILLDIQNNMIGYHFFERFGHFKKLRSSMGSFEFKSEYESQFSVWNR